jgi:signal transduction histidine kinase
LAEFHQDQAEDGESEYDVQFLDGDVDDFDVPEQPASDFAISPSHLIFDSRRQLTYWQLRAEDDCTDLERLFYPGLGLEDLIEKAVKLGILDIGGQDIGAYVNRRLERFAAGGSTFELQLSGDRWLRLTDHRQANGTTVTTLVNVTDVERRERAMALLLSENSDGGSKFERAARALSTGLGFHTATIARMVGDDTAEIIACLHEGHMAPPQCFRIRGTPCEPVYREGYFAFSGDFFRRFPRMDLHDYFADVGHGSYVGQVIYDKHGMPIGHILALDDAEHTMTEGDKRLVRLIAEHVAAEFARLDIVAALREGNKRFQDFTETASDLFFETGTDLCCTYVSDRVPEVTGISASDWIGRSMTEFGPEHDSAWEACLQDIANRRPFHDVFLGLPGTAGSSQKYAMSGKPVFDEHDHFTGYRLAVRTIQPNAQAEGRAREAELRVRQLLGSSLEGFALYNDDHRLVLCNDKFRALMFRGNEANVRAGMTLKQLSSLWLKSAPESDRRGLLNFHLDPDALSADYLDVAADDSKTLRVMKRRTEEGGVATLYLDITDLKHREQELSEARIIAENANSSKSQFLANISHELRTPLNAIIGFSEIMQEQILGPMTNPRYREYTTDIRTSAMHLLDMINDILDLSKAEAGQLELSPEMVDVSELVNSVVRLMREQAQAAQLHLVALIHMGIPPVKGDKRRMKQVLINLISNAIKFTPAGGTVEVTAQSKKGILEICVNDTGIGIAPDQMDKVFLPFGQVASEVSRRHAGTGLGLPLARHLVELHGGALTLSSELGQGTKVLAEFPYEDDQGGDEEAAA